MATSALVQFTEADIAGLEVLGSGIRSRVYALDDGRAIKVYNQGVPWLWANYEARYTNLAASCGAPAPGDVAEVAVGDRVGLIMERFHGDSLWEELARGSETSLEHVGVAMADTQLGLSDATVSLALPHQWDRLRHKLDWAITRYPELAPALDLLPPRDEVPIERLCHGDLHLRNVLTVDGGTVLVDWFDVSRGALVVAVARTLVLFDSETTGFDFASPIREAYLHRVLSAHPIDPDELDRWLAVQWVARLGEGLDAQHLPDVIAMVDKLSA